MRKLDHDRVGGAAGPVILAELRPQTPRLDSDDRIHARIVLRTAIENIAAHGVLFQLICLARQSAFDGLPQEALQAYRAPEALAYQDSSQLIVNFSRRDGLES